MARVSDLAIDLGTSNVLIYQKGKGIIIRQPAVVAIDRMTKKVVAIGADAYKMIGRTPGNIITVRPLENGTVVDMELANTMLRHFMNIAIGRRFFTRPRVVLSAPSGVGVSDMSSIVSILYDAGIRHTDLLPRPIAAAMGVGMDFSKPYGTMIVDMGAGSADIAVLAAEKIVESASVSCSGDYFDAAIVSYLRKKHSLLVGPRTAEEVKITIGSAVPPTTDMTFEVTGRDLPSGLPKRHTIYASEIYEALKHPVEELVEEIRRVLERTPAQLASDIFEDGIVLTGGAAALEGLAEAIYVSLHAPCGVADDPHMSVVQGCGRVLEHLTTYKNLLNESRNGLR